MKKNNWNGLVKIDEIKLISKEGIVLWEDKDLYNVVHYEGQQYMLSCLFSGMAIPSNYSIGLDNRATPAAGDVYANLTAYGEPSSANGYARSSVGSDSFTVEKESSTSSNYIAKSLVISFKCDTGSWTIRNMFLTATTLVGSTNTNFLISSIALKGGNTITVSAGNLISMRMSMRLGVC
jgi:hypothetical protein